MSNTLADSVEQLAFQLAEKLASAEIEKLVSYLNMLVHGKKSLETSRVSAEPEVSDDREFEDDPPAKKAPAKKAPAKAAPRSKAKPAPESEADEDEEPF